MKALGVVAVLCIDVMLAQDRPRLTIGVPTAVNRAVIWGTKPNCTPWTNQIECARKLASIDEKGKLHLENDVTPEDVINVLIKNYTRDTKRLYDEIEAMRKLPVRLMPKTGREDKI